MTFDQPSNRDKNEERKHNYTAQNMIGGQESIEYSDNKSRLGMRDDQPPKIGDNDQGGVVR